jgi:hypothetical protein
MGYKPHIGGHHNTFLLRFDVGQWVHAAQDERGGRRDHLLVSVRASHGVRECAAVQTQSAVEELRAGGEAADHHHVAVR